MIDPLASRTQAQFAKMLREVFGEHLKDNMRTSVPGHVLSFDPDTQLAEVQIGLMLEPRVGEPEQRRQIVRVPVQFWGGSGGTLECRIDSGVEGAIFFSQECIDSWVDQGGVAFASEPRRFSINDAYFIPGVRSVPGAITDFANDGIRLRNNSGSMYAWLKDDTSISLSNGAGFITIGADGTVNINGVTISPASLVTTPNDVFAGPISLKLHKHSGVQPGTGTSGVSVP
ncbi:Gp138 family membrane-puncturing spike protein [Pseudomonas juntendi]|uniref:Gp138 family membrane-puncturing spike protein n=1 Tax=Pseudomonas juntendi TaxID=2666183 RepID=UPI0024492062|nr:Gp138 family membrane-puncturing spike protein [Pseudomonas juntendi]MDG9888163.1 Gp138 family membrane-puncturing spike protein [Pseudomonas juntendi]